jgi:phosphoenolpyruvate carboxykinase (ATP)
MKQIARERIVWRRDPDWGYEVPAHVPGLDLARYAPDSYYSPKKYRELVEKLRSERRSWLSQFPGLDPVIPRAIES